MFYFKDCFQGWIGEGITSDMLAQVKPTRAGSSIGVVVAYGVNDAAQKAEEIISEGIDDKVIIEVFIEGGTEFTAIVVDVGIANNSEPVVLLPTEVELQYSNNSDTKEDTIFNYRKKYLPSRQVAYHSPPRFPAELKIVTNLEIPSMEVFFSRISI